MDSDQKFGVSAGGIQYAQRPAGRVQVGENPPGKKPCKFLRRVVLAESLGILGDLGSRGLRAKVGVDFRLSLSRFSKEILSPSPGQ